MMITYTQDKYMRLIRSGHDTVDKLAATGLRRTDIARSLKHLRAKGAITDVEPIRILISEYRVKGCTPPKQKNAKGFAAKPASDRVYIAKERKCLDCRSDFLSDWEGNRLCRNCTRSPAVTTHRVAGLQGAW